MQIVTTYTKVYTFDELSESAKERAIDNLRETQPYTWGDDNHASLKGFCDATDCRLVNYHYGLWGHQYADIEPKEDPGVTGLRLRTWVINNLDHLLTRGKGYGPYVSVNGKYRKRRRSRVIMEPTECPFTGYCMDDSLLAPLRDIVYRYDRRLHNSMDWTDLVRMCATAWLNDCIADIEWHDTDEAILEDIEANNYTFTEDGGIC